uniref:Cytochrome P450 n=1 Tax=Timema douglasi TaxID=61478 RepID=A0A7R8VSE1_TIMDO|nr:unnamed protein product [Timema douglasi]
MFVVLLAGCVVLYLLYKLSTSRPENFPPGPPSLPIYGSYWFVLLCNYKKLHKGFHTLARWYNTKLLGLHLGPFPTVVACDYATVKEVFTRPQFNGKLDCFLSQERSMGKTLGLFFTDDKLWIEQRRFTLRHLRDFGFARRFSPQEDVVRREVLDMVAFLSGSTSIQDHDVFRDGCALMPHIFSPAMINCLWSILASNHFPLESHGKLREVGAAAYFFLKEVQPTGGALLLTPWLRHFAPRTFGYTALVKGTGAVTDFVKVAVKEHRQTYLEDDARDFIDEYLKELKKCDSSSTFSDDQLLMIGTDLTIATSAALPAIISFAIILLVHYPEIQIKAQKEIDDVVGRDRTPSLDDKSSLPYIEAIQREVHRRQSLAPLSILRRCTEDTTLGGYFIPKNTVILPNLWAAHNDPEMWGDPHVFRPERFLDDAGQLLKQDLTLPFGGGRRVCVGETFSRHVNYLFLSALLQNFTFAAPAGRPIPKPDDVISGFTLSPPDFWVKVIPRN